MEWSPKDPDDTRIYPVDWSEIYPDSIVTATFTLTAGTVTLVEVDPDPRMAWASVAGGADGETATIEHEIVTALGQTFTKTITLLIGEGLDSLSPISTLTKGALVVRSLGELGIANYVFDIEAEEDIAALRILDEMADEFQADLNDFGYNQPATEGGSLPSDLLGVDRGLVSAFKYNLAVRLAPSYGKTPKPMTLYQAAVGRSKLFARYRIVQEVVMPSRTPRGAGNKFFGRRYFSGR